MEDNSSPFLIRIFKHINNLKIKVMEENLPKNGTLCLVRDFEDDGWSLREFYGVSTKRPFKYITYDKDTDEVEEWLMIKLDRK
jgi:hypothetical protein